jgi:hypothetical protein
MSDDLDQLDLTGIDQRHEPDPEFRAGLQRRVAAIVEGREPSDRSTGTWELTTVELEPARQPPGSPRRARAARIIVATSAAAVVAAIAVIVSRNDPTAPADAPSPSVIVGGPPALPTSTAAPPFDPYGANTDLVVGGLDPGTYAYLDVDRQGFNVRFTVPAGWTWNGRYLSKGGVGPPDGAAIFFLGGRVQVYADPCHWQSDPPRGDFSGSDVVGALAAQPMRSATTPTPRSAGFPSGPVRSPGMVVELTVPDNVDFAGCDRGQFRSWGPETMARSHQGPGQRDFVWAVDIMGAGVVDTEGRILVDPPPGGLIIDAASFPGTPAEVMSEIDAILGSIAVGHWG